MGILTDIALGLLAVVCSCWFFILGTAVYNLRRTTRLENLAIPDGIAWPKVSLIIPACNEGATLDAAMRSRLRETYPNMEFILVNDRSTDDTGDIADALALSDSRLRVVHVRSLPEGWLGKVHALQKGVEQSTGEWILFMDADVHMEPGTLERVVAYCLERGLDHVPLLPRLESKGFGLGIVNALFLRIGATSSPVWMVESPKTKTAAGGGAFSLFRRTALDRTPGMARLRLEVIDDVALGFLLKAHAARCSVINGASGVSLCWYESLNAMRKGFEKNGFAIARYSLVLLLLICSALVALEWAPYFAIAQATLPWLRVLGAAAAITQIAVSVSVSRWAHLAVAPAFFTPIAALILAFFLLRAGILALWRGGIVWRGTQYPLSELKEFQRNGQNMPLPPRND